MSEPIYYVRPARTEAVRYLPMIVVGIRVSSDSFVSVDDDGKLGLLQETLSWSLWLERNFERISL